MMQSNFIEITLLHGCSLVNVLHIFRTVSHKDYLNSSREKGDKKISEIEIMFIYYFTYLYLLINKINGEKEKRIACTKYLFFLFLKRAQCITEVAAGKCFVQRLLSKQINWY